VWVSEGADWGRVGCTASEHDGRRKKQNVCEVTGPCMGMSCSVTLGGGGEEHMGSRARSVGCYTAWIADVVGL
jgi:hypothetical protein